jgi:drug/metabolite transporter (DMT)-like permease
MNTSSEPDSPSLAVIEARPSFRRGVWVMVASVLGFSLNTLLLRHLTAPEQTATPEMALLFRAAVGIAVVLLAFRGRRPTEIRPVFVNRGLILRGFTGLLGTAAYYYTVPGLGAGRATLISTTYFVFAPIIAVFTLGEFLTWRRVCWIALAFLGIAGLVQNGEGVTLQLASRDEWIALAGAVLAAWSVVLVRGLTASYSIGTIYLAQCVWILLPLALIAGPDLGELTMRDWLLLTVAALAASFGQLAMNEGYRILSVTTGASIQMLWPVLTSLGGIYFFHEAFALVQMLGAAVILLAIWRLTLDQARLARHSVPTLPGPDLPKPI